MISTHLPVSQKLRAEWPFCRASRQLTKAAWGDDIVWSPATVTKNKKAAEGVSVAMQYWTSAHSLLLFSLLVCKVPNVASTACSTHEQPGLLVLDASMAMKQ